MTAAKIPDADFIQRFREVGPTQLAKFLDTPIAGVMRRRRNLERKHQIALNGPKTAPEQAGEQHPPRAAMKVKDGIVLVGSDLHAWPGQRPTAFRALVRMAKEMRPAAVVMNGDVIDGASISRHPPIGWEKLPSLVEEIEAAQELLHEVVLAVPRATRLFWPLGNHDARFSTRLATVAPEFAKIHGIKLQDHFGERWEPCWSVWFNEEVVVKHRQRGGIHAVYNNVLVSGKSMVTGHLHSLKVTPFSDYSPNPRFGVDTGCLADKDSPAFRYLEDGPVNWRSGFAVLTFRNGRLMWPELVHVLEEGMVEFRGEILRV